MRERKVREQAIQRWSQCRRIKEASRITEAPPAACAPPGPAPDNPSTEAPPAPPPSGFHAPCSASTPAGLHVAVPRLRIAQFGPLGGAWT